MFGADRLDVVLRPVDDSCMERSIVADSELVPRGAKRNRRWHTVEEKRRIVEETLVSGASVSQVAFARCERQPSVPLEMPVPGRAIL